jgi:hypothetical protein
MSDLPQIVNLPFEIEIGENKLLVKRAGIFELAQLRDFLEKNTGNQDIKVLPYAIYLCAKKVYPDITEDYVNDIMPAILLIEKPDLVSEIMQKLGFILPPKSKRTEEAKK